MTITLESAKEAFLAAGWHLDHTSQKNGEASSHYFTRFEGEFPNRKQVRVRVSDHHLGCTVYGESQGQNLDMDLVISDYDAEAIPEDFVVMADNRDAFGDCIGGIAPSTDPEEWAEAVAANS